MDENQEELIEEPLIEEPLPPPKLNIPALLVLGILAGAGGAILQLRSLRYGAIAPDQLVLFWGFFLLVGVAAAIAAGSAAARILRRSQVAYAVAIITPVVLFLLFVPANTRGLPHVYFLITDTTRSDHLSLYGYERETTPFLEELASGGVVFSNSVSTGTHTIVSTPCIIASIYPSEHGIVGYSNVLSNRFTLISEYLQELGYGTYGYATNPHLGPRNGYAQGFDKYEHDPGWAHTPAAQVNGKFLSWIDSREDEVEKPIFAFLFYIDPHNPYSPPPAYRTLYDPEWKGEPISDWKHEYGEPEPAKLFNMIAQYDGSIKYWDAELRKLTAELVKRDLFENSLVVYTSDHGEEFWEHDFWGHNKIMYEPSCAVPLLISFPVPIHFPPLPRTSRVVEEVVSSVDIVPTMLEFLRVEPDESVRGRSALPLVYGGEEGPERIAYCEEILQRYGPYDIRAIRTRTQKYIRVLNFEGDENYGDLFFDLEADPGETRNLIDSLPEDAALHAKLLDIMMAEIAGIGEIEADTVAVDPAVLERLRALGYIGD